MSASSPVDTMTRGEVIKVRILCHVGSRLVVILLCSLLWITEPCFAVNAVDVKAHLYSMFYQGEFPFDTCPCPHCNALCFFLCRLPRHLPWPLE